MTGVYNGRSGYDLRTVVGPVMNVADNEPAPQTTPHGSAPGFVVGHHPGHVTVDVRRRQRVDLTSDEAHELGMLLLWAADLARLTGAA
jgi:hypothetical protein